MLRFISALLFALTLYLSLSGAPALVDTSDFGALSPARALADSPFATLLPGARAAYRFDYKGDRSRIEVALDAQGIPGVEL